MLPALYAIGVCCCVWQAKQKVSQAQASSSSSSQAASAGAPAPAQQQQQSPEQPPAGAAARRVAAFVGGRSMKESDGKLLPMEVTEVGVPGFLCVLCHVGYTHCMEVAAATKHEHQGVSSVCAMPAAASMCKHVLWC